MIRDRIKNETRDQHNAVENVSFGNKIMSNQLTLEEYERLLKANYILNVSFEKSWDNLSFKTPESLLLSQRKKLELLKADFAALAIEEPELPKLQFPSDTYPEFMGSLYVFEGSTLGGSVISKKLVTNPNLQDLNAFNFYQSYGEKTGYYWKTFLEELEKITNKDEVDSAIAAAKTTFNITGNVFQSMSSY